MSLHRLFTSAALVCTLLFIGACASNGAAASDAAASDAAAASAAAADAAPEEPRDPEADMAAYMQFGTPGEAHARMARSVGEWDVAHRTWMDPSAPPTEGTGKARFTSILGGRYIRQDYETTFMGMPYTGFGMDAYDNGRGVYISTWYDSMGTAPFTTEGSYDEATRTLSYEGTTWDPVMEMEQTMRIVVTDRSDDEMVMMMHMALPDGSWAPMMEMTYTRRK